SSAMRLPLPICIVNGCAACGRWRTVWPCEPMAATRDAATPASRSSALAASAKAMATRASSSPSSSSEPGSPPCPRTTRVARRSGSQGKVRPASRRQRARSASSSSTSAASMPSALVPEIRPRKRVMPGGYPCRSGAGAATWDRLAAMAAPTVAARAPLLHRFLRHQLQQLLQARMRIILLQQYLALPLGHRQQFRQPPPDPGRVVDLARTRIRILAPDLLEDALQQHAEHRVLRAQFVVAVG